MRGWRGLAGIALAVILACGCASTGTRTGELLAEDYSAMSDAELRDYYHRLGDQIDRVERQSTGTGTGVGIGIGSYPVHLGVSGSVGRETVADDLRDRRNEVRGEMARREVPP